MLYFQIEYTVIILVQFITGSKRKTLSLEEKSLENDSEHFVSDIIFKDSYLYTLLLTLL